MVFINYQHTQKGNNQKARYNAYQIATRGGKLKRVSLSNYRKAYSLAEDLDSLNNFADYVANFDNSPRYTEEKSERLNNRLEERAKEVAQGLKAFGLVFFNNSHYYSIARKGEASIIYLKGE